MFLKNEDLEILKDIELYLFNKNSKTIITEKENFIIKTENIEDLKAMELYFKLYGIIENLESKKEENNKKNYSRIKAKRKNNKNYARKKLETGKYC